MSCVRDRLGTPVTLVTNRFTNRRSLRSPTRAPPDALQTPYASPRVVCWPIQPWRGDALGVNSYHTGRKQAPATTINNAKGSK
jgi:hypothetical protein